MNQGEEVLDFYCGQLNEEGCASPEVAKTWWTKDPAFDRKISEQFGALHAELNAGRRFDWMDTPRGLVAAIIVLDQFSRNMFRDTAGMYATDERALALSFEALALGLDGQLPATLRAFIYMPLMHAERLDAQNRCIELFDQMANESKGEAEKIARNYHGYAIQHRDIVERFGRFPHRNEIVARPSTEEELAFLKEDGSSF